MDRSVVDGSVLSPFDCLAGALGLPEWISAQVSDTAPVHGFVTVTVDDLTITWANTDGDIFVLIHDEDPSAISNIGAWP